MRVTVGICTWNRAQLLAQTLQQMQQLEIPAGVQWEILVVNNNCTDHTDQVLEEYSEHLPIRRIFEPTPGKSFALNTAIKELESDLILWTDDDVLVEPHWLFAYVKAAQGRPEASFFGGPIDPWFETVPPSWIDKAWPRIASAYAVRECDKDIYPVERDSLPYGANFAIRTVVQKHYLYNTNLGRVGSGQRRGEETEVIERMLDDGNFGYWCPEACVKHFIPKSRLNEHYIRHFFYGIGQTDAALKTDPDRGVLMMSGRQGYSLAKALYAELRFQYTRRACRPRRWVKDLTKCGYYWGRRAG